MKKATEEDLAKKAGSMARFLNLRKGPVYIEFDEQPDKSEEQFIAYVSCAEDPIEGYGSTPLLALHGLCEALAREAKTRTNGLVKLAKEFGIDLE